MVQLKPNNDRNPNRRYSSQSNYFNKVVQPLGILTDLEDLSFAQSSQLFLVGIVRSVTTALKVIEGLLAIGCSAPEAQSPELRRFIHGRRQNAENLRREAFERNMKSLNNQSPKRQPHFSAPVIRSREWRF